MLIDIQAATPYLVVILASILAALGWYIRTVGNKLSEVAIKLATLIEHTLNTDTGLLDIKKNHDEIIELKIATAELDTKFANMERQLDSIYAKTN